MKKLSMMLVALALTTVSFTACSDDDNDNKPQPVAVAKDSIDLQNYFVAGTLGASNKSVYVVQFLEDKKALFLNSSSSFLGTYEQKGKLITMEVNDKANYRIMKFLLNDSNQIAFSYYQALETPYLATGALIKVASENQFKGKTFKGAEYKWGKLNDENFTYKFNKAGTKYGSGTAGTDYTTDKKMEIINNSVFRYKDGSYSEMGYVAGDSLSVFKYDKLYYFGVYKQQ